MAKPGVSKKNRQPSLHSRAARRATDVDIDTDKSLKEVKAPAAATDFRPSVLNAQHNSGVSKKTKNRKAQMSAKAKERKERAADRAEAIMGRTSTKTEKSKDKARRVQTRSKQWEDINKGAIAAKKFPDEEDLEVEQRQTKSRTVEVAAGKDWETDEEMDGADDDVAAPAPAPAAAAVSAPPPANDDFDEEIL